MLAVLGILGREGHAEKQINFIRVRCNLVQWQQYIIIEAEDGFR